MIIYIKGGSKYCHLEIATARHLIIGDGKTWKSGYSFLCWCAEKEICSRISQCLIPISPLFVAVMYSIEIPFGDSSQLNYLNILYAKIALFCRRLLCLRICTRCRCMCAGWEGKDIHDSHECSNHFLKIIYKGEEEKQEILCCIKISGYSAVFALRWLFSCRF